MGSLTKRLGSNQVGCDRAGLKSKERTRLRLFNLHLSQQGLAFHRRSGQAAGRRRLVFDPGGIPIPPRKRSPRRKTARSGTSEAFHWAWTWFRILRGRKVPDATRGTSGTPGATGTRVRHSDFSHLADYFRIADHPGATGLDTSVACALDGQLDRGAFSEKDSFLPSYGFTYTIIAIGTPGAKPTLRAPGDGTTKGPTIDPTISPL